MEPENLIRTIPEELSPISTFRAHTDSVDFIKLHTKSSSPFLVSASHDKSLKIWDIQNQSCLSTLQGHTQGVFCCDVNSSGLIASCSPDETVRIWDSKTSREVSRGLGHSYKIYFVLFIDDNQIVSCGRDHKILQWDTKKMNSPVRRIGDDSSGTFRSLAYKNNTLIASTAESTIEAYTYSSGQPQFKQSIEFDSNVFDEEKVIIGDPSIIYTIKFMQNEEILTGHQDMAIRKFHKVGSGLEQNMLRRCHFDFVRHIELFPDESKMITTCQDGSGRIWENFRPKYSLTGHSQIASCACITPDSSRAFISSYDQSISIFSLA